MNLHWLYRSLPFLVIGLAYAWSLSVVGARVFKTKSSEKTVIRIAHWQLEAGVREGLISAAKDYQKLHPHVEIQQEAIPESTYGQWLSVQLLGGNAPDIVEMGNIAPNLMTMFYQRYLTPITPYVSQPNPYNKGTSLETTPLLNTFLDGMRQSFIDEIQEYMTISLSRMGVRLFYNKTLLKSLTGADEAPTDFRSFMELCEKIRTHKQPNGSPYVPISGSNYHLSGWNQSIFFPITYGAYRDIDLNRDGRVGNDEWALSFLTGRIDFNHPSYRNTFQMITEITQFFQPGWIGLSRDEAIFNFAQQKAIFISSGLWEAGGLEQLAEGKFEIGIVDFPLPTKDDPNYGHLVEGPRYENPGGSVPFAITKTSQHPDIALDFLLFLSSQKQNELFNAKLGWLPIIDGAQTSEKLAVFEPTLQGVFPAFFPILGGESAVRWPQLQALFLVGQLDYDGLAKAYTEFFEEKGKADFAEFLRNQLRGQSRHFQLAGSMRARALQGENEADWAGYRLVALRATDLEMRQSFSQRFFYFPEEAKQASLYQYTPQAQQRLRETYSPGAKTPSGH